MRVPHHTSHFAINLIVEGTATRIIAELLVDSTADCRTAVSTTVVHTSMVWILVTPMVKKFFRKVATRIDTQCDQTRQRRN